jgi:two-component system, NarL family, response regulator NreC
MADLHLVPAPAEALEFSPPAPIRVLLAEDHALLRSGLRVVLDEEEDVEVIAEAEDLESALGQIRGERPQVLVLDLGMLGGSVRETIRKLRAQAPGMQVVLLTMDESPVVAQHVLACGAVGLVLKDRADDELATAVRAAASGEEYVSERVAGRLDAALRRSLTEA